MCIHPRCGKKGRFRLDKTELGPNIDLCEVHGPVYHKSYGGEISLLFPYMYQRLWQKKLSDIRNGENNG